MYVCMYIRICSECAIVSKDRKTRYTYRWIDIGI